MNDTPLQPENADEFFHITRTRPSPILPPRLELGILEVSHLRTPKGELYPETESYYCSLIWGISGQFSLYVNGMRHTVRGGDFLLLEQGGTIRADADDEDNSAYYLLLDGPQAKTIVQDVGLWCGIFPTVQPPNVWLERIAREMNHLKSQENIASIGHALLISAAHDAKKSAPDKMVWDACCYLQKNWSKPRLNVEDVLNHLKTSRSTLSPRFRKATGKSILDYLMDIRYRNALKMLQYDYATISKIAHRCGFPDASYFSTWFRKRNGAPPRTMKKKSSS